MLKLIGVAVAVVLVSGVGVAAYAAYDLTASFTSDAVALEGQDPVPPDIGAIEGGVNLFIAGTDACEPEYAAVLRRSLHRRRTPVASSTTSTCSSTSPTHPRRVTVISFPRDLMVPIPSCTREGRQRVVGDEQAAAQLHVLRTAGCRAS